MSTVGWKKDERVFGGDAANIVSTSDRFEHIFELMCLVARRPHDSL